MPSASPSFSINGGAQLTMVAVAASGSVVATLDDLSGVTSVAWEIEKTDDTTTAAAYTLLTSGPRGSVCTTTALTAGTAAVLKCTVNSGVDPQTGQPSDAMTARCKFGVLTAGGDMVGCFDEEMESSAVYGTTAIVNTAVRKASAAYASVGTAVTAATPNTIPLRGASAEIAFGTITAPTITSAASADLAVQRAGTTRLLLTSTGIEATGNITSPSASDLVFQRAGVTQLTMSSGTSTFVGIVAASTLTSAAATDLVLQRGAATILTLGASTSTFSGSVTTNTVTSAAATDLTLSRAGSARLTLGASTVTLASGINLASTGNAAFGSVTAEYLQTTSNPAADGVLRCSADSTLVAARTTSGSDTVLVLQVANDLVGLGDPAAANGIQYDTKAGTSHTFNVDSLAGLQISEAGGATQLGFNGATPISKPTVTGSRGGNAALASLLTALANFGLITDSTTA